MNKIVWEVSSFEGLDSDALYKIARLRSEVFVVEQKIIYLDLDNKDQRALHLMGYFGDDLIAYCRIFKPGDYLEDACIGRVAVSKNYRKQGYGHLLMDKAIALIGDLLKETVITISAQLYLKSFYETHKFNKISDEYLEDHIPHIRMKRN